MFHTFTTRSGSMDFTGIPPAAGTRRSDSVPCSLSVVGISGIHAGEDVKLCFPYVLLRSSGSLHA